MKMTLMKVSVNINIFTKLYTQIVYFITEWLSGLKEKQRNKEKTSKDDKKLHSNTLQKYNFFLEVFLVTRKKLIKVQFSERDPSIQKTHFLVY